VFYIFGQMLRPDRYECFCFAVRSTAKQKHSNYILAE
jgi:hypothetical protein